MLEYNRTNHLLIWEKPSPPTPAGSKKISLSGQMTLLENLLIAPTFWRISRGKTITKGYINGARYRGLLQEPDAHVSGFCVIKGRLGRAMKLANTIDWSFVNNYILDPEAQAHVDVYSSLSFVRIAGVDATMVLLWTLNNTGTTLPNLPIHLVMDFYLAFNTWGRSLKNNGDLLDSGRINVRFETYNVDLGVVTPGRKKTDRLEALATYPNDGMKAEDAMAASGLDPNRFLLDIGRANGWWSAAADSPEYCDDPRNAIIL